MESRIPAFQSVPSIAASSDCEKLGVYDGLNATACSFYSSQGTHRCPQELSSDHSKSTALIFTHCEFCGNLMTLLGRIDSAFDDRNESVVESLIAKHPELYTLEMETFHLYVSFVSIASYC